MPSPFQIRQAVRLLASGGIIAYPTEAVYGLGCDPLDYAAVRRLLRIKQRPVDKGLILVAADFAQLRGFVAAPGAELRERLEASWPGPVTWLLPATTATPFWLTGAHRTLAVRVTAHPLAATLCAAYGAPLVSTSANRAGRPPARTALQVRRRCAGIDLVLHGPTGGLARPTEVRDALSGARVRGG